MDIYVERFLSVLDDSGKAYKMSQVAKKVKSLQSKVSQLRGGNTKKLSIELLAALYELNPSISFEYILLGSGGKFIDDKNQQESKSAKVEKDDNVGMDRLVKIIESQQRTIENLSQKGGAADASNAVRKEAHG